VETHSSCCAGLVVEVVWTSHDSVSALFVEQHNRCIILDEPVVRSVCMSRGS